MNTSKSTGIIVTAEQIPILRDVIATHHLDVFIRDTQDAQLLDEQWKPWVRRVRPQLLHCPANIWLYTPSYAWPDNQSQHRIRSIIAEQIQQCIQMAKLLGATGLVVPLEHAYSAFHDRIAYYLLAIETQLHANDLQLMLHAAPIVSVVEVNQLCTHISSNTNVLMQHTAFAQVDQPTHPALWYAEIATNAEEETLDEAHWLHHHIIGADESTSAIRKKVLWAINLPAHHDNIEHSQHDTSIVDSITEVPEVADTDSTIVDGDNKVS